MIKSFIKKKLFSRNELRTYLAIALPMIISQSTETIMFFTDRIFLSNYKEDQGELYLSASLTGGITSFFLCAIFIYIINYNNTITAQYFGAKQYKNCAQVGAQSFYFGLFCYPIILLIILFVPSLYNFFEYTPQQTELQITYTNIILIGSIFTIVRHGISGFFIGIGNTKIVMYANVFGLLINIPLNYLLINGIIFFPELGIDGAAIATVLSSIISLLLQLFIYFGKKMHRDYNTKNQLQFNKAIFKKIIFYGTPQGIESLFGIGAFSYFLLIMNTFGPEVGAAVSIAINWDTMFFIPMIGAQFATTSLVGRYMGAKDIVSAKRVINTSLSIMFLYAAFIIFFFLTLTPIFIYPFMATLNNPQSVYSLASIMLKISCLYLIADVVHLTFSGVLRGAGDTKAPMYIFILLSIIFVIIINIVISQNIVSPIEAWLVFTGFVISLGVGMFARYLQGKWKTINVI